MAEGYEVTAGRRIMFAPGNVGMSRIWFVRSEHPRPAFWNERLPLMIPILQRLEDAAVSLVRDKNTHINTKI